ncbi:MAG: hypothetical protein F4X66_06955 [Chloroflexi bacterium]|nr:hypothetical protein [Chloroflexota bacterium]
MFLLLMAAAVGVNYIITVLYDDGSTGFPIWSIFNWPMAAGVLIAFTASACHWRQQGRAEANIHSSENENRSVKAWLQANMRFYASLILLLWFMHAWFDDLFADDAGGGLWISVNVMLVAVSLSAGLQLWQDGGGEE